METLVSLDEIYNYALLCSIGVVPVSWIGCMIEQTPRSGIVAAFAMILLFLCLAHFPLFD